MKKILKFIRNFIIAILLLAIIIVGLIIARGYKMYDTALKNTDLKTKISEIKSKENYTKIDNIPKDLQNATIAVEDHRFYEHEGMDIIALGRAILINITEFSIEQGGSTITQQLAKNMYFSQEQEFSRKVAEALMAFELEKNFSKEEILELYLNTIYYGDGYYGIKRASRGYFDKEPSELDLYECTLLAGVPNAPSVYAPTVNAELCRQRQEQVIGSMVKYEYLSEEVAKSL